MLEFGSDQRLKRYEIEIWGHWHLRCEDVAFSENELSELNRVLPQFLPLVNFLCLRAHEGDLHSQVEMGNIYRWGRRSISADPIRAYVWYSLAGEGGKRRKENASSLMTPAQIAEAERLAAEWQPNPAECEQYEVAAE